MTQQEFLKRWCGLFTYEHSAETLVDSIRISKVPTNMPEKDALEAQLFSAQCLIESCEYILHGLYPAMSPAMPWDELWELPWRTDYAVQGKVGIGAANTSSLVPTIQRLLNGLGMVGHQEVELPDFPSLTYLCPQALKDSKTKVQSMTLEVLMHIELVFQAVEGGRNVHAGTHLSYANAIFLDVVHHSVLLAKQPSRVASTTKGCRKASQRRRR